MPQQPILQPDAIKDVNESQRIFGWKTSPIAAPSGWETTSHCWTCQHLSLLLAKRPAQTSGWSVIPGPAHTCHHLQQLLWPEWPCTYSISGTPVTDPVIHPGPITWMLVYASHCCSEPPPPPCHSFDCYPLCFKNMNQSEIFPLVEQQLKATMAIVSLLSSKMSDVNILTIRSILHTALHTLGELLNKVPHFIVTGV